MRNKIIYLIVLLGLIYTAYGANNAVSCKDVQQGDTAVVKGTITAVVPSPAAAAPRAAFNPGKIGINQAVRPGEVPDRIINVESASSSNYPDRPISYYWEYFIGETEEIGCYEEEVWRRIPGATWEEYQPGPIMQNTQYRRVATNGIETAYTYRVDIDADFSQYYPGDIWTFDTIVNYGEVSIYFLTNGDSWSKYYYFDYEWEFQYEMSTDNVRWKAVEPNLAEGCGGTFMDDGTDACFYYQLPLHQTTYFRRRTTRGNWTGKSNVIKVRVTYKGVFDPGEIEGDQTIAKYSYPEPFTSASDAGAPGVSPNDISYEWEYSVDNQTWSSVGPLYEAVCMSGDYYSPSYEHYFDIKSTTYFRRKAMLLDTAVYSNVITVNVREPKVDPGIIGNDQNVGYGQMPERLVNLKSASSESLGGVRYQWQKSANQVDWEDIDGAVSYAYTPDTRAEATTYFRRAAKSPWASDPVYSNVVKIAVRLTGGLIDDLVYTPSGIVYDIKNIMSPVSAAGMAVYVWEEFVDGKWKEIESEESFGESLSRFMVLEGIPQVIRRKIIYGGEAAYSNICFVLPGRDYSNNYVAATKYVGNGDSIPNASNTKVVYYDGLGYPSQNIDVMASPVNETDVITPIYYDNMRRSDARVYLPYESESDKHGLYSPLCMTLQKAYYDVRFDASNGDYAYTANVYEASPLNRVVRSYNAGADFQGSADKARSLGYALNQDNEVFCFTLGADMSLKVDGHYVAGALYRNSVTNEDGVLTIVYTDILGKALLSRVVAEGGAFIDTYTVYDDLGRVAWVISPEGSALLASGQTILVDDDFAAKYCYLYKYDGFGRVVYKRIPGRAEDLYVYDSGDRIVMQQDGRLRAGDQWLMLKYDAYGRQSSQTLASNVSSQAALQAVFDSGQGSSLYTDAAELCTEAKYDTNYDTSLFVPVDNVVGRDQLSDNVVNMKTYERILDNKDDGVPRYLHRHIFYDDKGRVIQTVETGETLNDTLYISYKYDFTGNVLSEHQVYNKQDTLQKRFVYDVQGRLIADTTTLNGSDPAVVSYGYDIAGRVVSRTMGYDTVKFNETRSYNIQGWMKELDNDMFSARLSYYDPVTAGVTPSYTGNVTEWAWTHRGADVDAQIERMYTFAYDKLGRIVNSGYKTGDDAPGTPFTEGGISYDRNGNMLAMKRYSGTSAVTDLGYTYEGNRLLSAGGKNYTYDANGNMVSDGSRNFKYNYLNLLSEVLSSDNDTIVRYSFSADGVKRRVGNGAGGYRYSGSFVYADNAGVVTLESVPFSAGRIVRTNSGYSVRYHFTDHLGSVRAVVDGDGNVVERNDYYPFGKRHEVAAYPISTNRDRFNGKELQTTGDLGWLDYGARMYDPELARWTVTDPLAEKYYGISPYAYCANNPVKFVDPNGMEISPIYDEEGDFLGTDDEGLQGNAIVMRRDNFKQGMSHKSALSHSLGVQGLAGADALGKLSDHYRGLKDRPDYDGKLTLSEANDWYRNGSGEPLFADLGKLDLSGVKASKFDKDKDVTYFNLLFLGNVKDGLVYGSFGLHYLGNGQVSSAFDEYNFDMKSWNGIGNIVRNMETIVGGIVAGQGTPYRINFYGTGKINPN